MSCVPILRFVLLALSAFSVVAPSSLTAQSYPTQTIKIVVPTAAGGPNDIVGRLAAEILGKLGQPVVVENRAGVGGALAAREVAKARPDGYTLMVGNTSTLAVNPAVSANAGYDPLKSFVPVAKFWEAYQVLAVQSASPWVSVKALVDQAKANPGKLDYAHGGTGNLQHLIGEMLMQRSGIKIVGVPFRGSAEAVTAVLGQTVHLTFADASIVLPLVQDGKLRALAVTSAVRTSLAPALPTMMEAGVPDFEATSFFGIVAPAGTSGDIVGKLNAAINEGLATPQSKTLIARLGVEFVPGTPEAFGAFIAAKAQQWTDVAKVAGVRTN